MKRCEFLGCAAAATFHIEIKDGKKFHFCEAHSKASGLLGNSSYRIRPNPFESCYQMIRAGIQLPHGELPETFRIIDVDLGSPLDVLSKYKCVIFCWEGHLCIAIAQEYFDPHMLDDEPFDRVWFMAGYRPELFIAPEAMLRARIPEGQRGDTLVELIKQGRFREFL